MAEAAKKTTVGEDNPLAGFRQKIAGKPPVPTRTMSTRTTPERAAQEQPKQEKKKTAFLIPVELTERARDCVYWLSGPPHRLTMGELCAQALEREIKRLEKEHGKPFEPRAGELKGGARVG